MIYHIWINDDTRISINDEVEETEGQCISLAHGEILSDEEERLDAARMDASFAEVLARYDLYDPEQRAYLQRTFEETRVHAEKMIDEYQGKLTDHGVMLMLSNKYLAELVRVSLRMKESIKAEAMP